MNNRGATADTSETSFQVRNGESSSVIVPRPAGPKRRRIMEKYLPLSFGAYLRHLPWYRSDPDRSNLVQEASVDGVDCITGNPEFRVVHVNRPSFEQQGYQQKFCSNHITTAKYSKLSFLPCFLFEQFRRYSNCFFLFIALLQQIPDVSPTGRYTTLVPLIFILLVSALKEIIEDYKRHRADWETNERKVEVLKESHWVPTQWQNIVVGDIVKVHNNNFFPADLVVISTSEPQGMCYIETMNLDGETNLKIRQSLADTWEVCDTTSLDRFSATIECELPNKHLYEFNGNLRYAERIQPLGPERILLRGAMLRNTSWAFGVVIYTGHETKLMKNSTRAPLKRSTVDKITNTQVLMLFFALVLLCILSSLFSEIWTRENLSHSYIAIVYVAASNFGYNLLTFVILYNNLIPISLQVTLEVVRFVQAIFINMDIDMYDEESDTPAMARTSNLNEELGMVKYIFSDKTGTLTRNEMEFKQCSVAGKVYDALGVNANPEDSYLIQELRKGGPGAETIREFLILMSVCHTVIPEKLKIGEIVYHASSPDERALLHGAKSFGFVFDVRTPNSVEIFALGQRETYEILNVIEFTSARKRMSVIVRKPSGSIVLYCKGADSVIYERLAPESQAFREDTLNHLKMFASAGLRTLCFAMTELSQQDYDDWNEIYKTACTAMNNRETKVEEAATLIEKNLYLLGATAVEDRLQDKVPDTIAALLEAGINVWVLTGDKQETAINIGYSTRLFSQNDNLHVINETTLNGVKHRLKGQLDSPDRNGPMALVIDGQSLKFALSPELRKDFLSLCLGCKSVVCCRVSPMQKAEVVELIAKDVNCVTLAIGDGANDVAMIQKAHVGVGISGVEGLQASCASDYSIAQFRFLLKLLFVHGTWNYDRMCKLILYSFYKNICLYVMELWFAIYSGWSGQVLFERWTIGLYNVLFTAAPPFAIGLFDKVCSESTMLNNPKLYGSSTHNFGVTIFWIWIFNALGHSVMLFWLPKLAMEQDVAWPNGRDGGYLMLGNMVYTYVVVTVCWKAGLHINFWTKVTWLAIWLSIFAWFLLILVYSHIWPILPFGQVMMGMDFMLFSSMVFWTGLLLIPFATLVPDIVFLVIKRTLFKSDSEGIRERELFSSDKNSHWTNRKNEKKKSVLNPTVSDEQTARVVVVRSPKGKSAHKQESQIDSTA